jgi:hypothetical protein
VEGGTIEKRKAVEWKAVESSAASYDIPTEGGSALRPVSDALDEWIEDRLA